MKIATQRITVTVAVIVAVLRSITRMAVAVIGPTITI
jgi:hypothetical protein